MRRFRRTVFIAAILASLLALLAPVRRLRGNLRQGASARPALVVVLVVDQLPERVLERLAHRSGEVGCGAPGARLHRLVRLDGATDEVTQYAYDHRPCPEDAGLATIEAPAKIEGIAVLAPDRFIVSFDNDDGFASDDVEIIPLDALASRAVLLEVGLTTPGE